MADQCADFSSRNAQEDTNWSPLLVDEYKLPAAKERAALCLERTRTGPYAMTQPGLLNTFGFKFEK